MGYRKIVLAQLGAENVYSINRCRLHVVQYSEGVEGILQTSDFYACPIVVY